MSYLFDKLKEALGGKYLVESKDVVIKDWSPNSIRAIFIARNQIIIVNHLGVFGGCTKKVDLDVGMVAQDLDEISRTNYGKPKLNSLLTKRSFSCLEEIYVDAMFQNYPQVLDIVGYVRDMVNSNSRLRYFGYGDLTDIGLRDYLNQAYKEAYSRRDYGYAFATDRKKQYKLEYKDVGNKEWYKKYYLRPQFYGKDRQGGDLDIHFKKIEEGYPEMLRKKTLELSKHEFKDKFIYVTGKDIANKEYFQKIDKMLAYLLKSSDDIAGLVLGNITKITTKKRTVEGLNKSLFLPDNGFTDGYILKCYENYKVLDGGKGTLDIDKYAEGLDGFIPLTSILDEICCTVTYAMAKNGYKELSVLAMLDNMGTPDGNFYRQYLSKMGIKEGGTLNGYLDYIGDIIGIDIMQL